MFSEEVQNIFYVLVPPFFVLLVLAIVTFAAILVAKKLRKK